jgi:hypothetical protein
METADTFIVVANQLCRPALIEVFEESGALNVIVDFDLPDRYPRLHLFI